MAPIAQIPRHRLAALWFADIVGFSGLSHEDESRALEMVQLFQTITRRVVHRYGGRLVKFTGDGALAEFPSTEAAVRSVCRLRKAFVEDSEAHGLGTQDLRVGVHVGEVVTLPDGDLYGDGVNVTSRIMHAASPGQILASEDVWHQLRQRKEFHFEELGAWDLKGVGQLVVYSTRVGEQTSSEWPDIGPMKPQTGLAAFYSELRRRNVLRTVAVYVLIAGLVTLLATFTVPALYLPAWVTSGIIILGLLGLPIVLVLAWVLGHSREGVRRVSSPGSEIALPWFSSWSWRRRGMVMLLAMLVLTGLWVSKNRWSPRSAAASSSAVVVLPFNVRGGDALDYLGEGMVSLISTKLGGVEQFHSVDPHATLNFVRRMGFRSINPQSGETVANRFGAGYYVLGNVVEAGNQLHLDASLYRSGREEPLTQVSVQGQTERLAPLVDQLVGMMLEARVRGSRTSMTSLASMTTDSLEALKAYLHGEREYRAGRFSSAIEAFQRAVAIDSLFSLAYYRLGISANWIPDYGIAQKAAEEALRHSARLSPPDLTLVEAFSALQTVQSTRVIRLLRPYLDAYPDNVDAWFMYGEVLFHYNGLRGRPMAEARQPFERALGLDPDNSTLLIHLMEITANEGDFATFDSLLQRVEPGSEFELQWQSLRDFALGTPSDQDRRIVGLREAREDQLRLAIQKLAGYAPGGAAGVRSARLLLEPDRSRGEQRSGRLWMIQLQTRAGRWEAVKAEIEALRPLDPNRAVQFHALYGALPFLSLPETELKGLRTEVIGWRPGGEDGGPFDPLYREYLIGLLSVRLGDTSTARTAMERLGGWTGSTAEANVGRFLAHHINAHLTRRSGRSREALRLLSEPAVELPELPQSELHHSPFIWHPYERFARAELLLEEGREEEALAWYGVLMEGLSWLNLPYAPISHLRSAQIYEQLGRRADATHHYAEFVRYWKDCDPVLQPLVAEAQERLASLTVSESGKLSAVQ